MRYKFLPHTADEKFQAFGKSLEEAFENAAYAMISIITEDKIRAKVRKKISIKSENEKSLLYDFLERILFLIDAKNFILGKIIKMKIKKEKNALSLEAVLIGDDKIENYKTKKAIKAVTYEDMLIGKKKDEFFVQVIVDI